MGLTDRVTRTGRVDEVDGSRRPEEDVESNARLTASTAVVLLVLLAAEGITILSVRSLLSPHIFIGMLLVPPVLLKIGSTSYRFVRYYRGSPAYRRKGPPPVVLRLLGPFVVAFTVIVLATGIALLVEPRSLRQSTLFLHKASFVLWFGAMTIHVLGHLLETTRVAPRDWVSRTRRDVRRAGARRWALVASVALGVPLGLLFVGRAGPWEAQRAPAVSAVHRFHHRHRVPPPAPTPARSQGPSSVPTTTIARPHLGGVSAITPPPVPSGIVSVPTTTPTKPSAHHRGKAHPHHHVTKKPKHGA
ncbi:MAG TPA: hypothetical protein VNC61_14585 [Acidimicrobiales bacterium]|nr:hypothetical protein [Acidimicrobiales bacterium]